MAILLSVVFGLLVYPIHVAGLTLCDTDGTLEVVESTASNVFTCTGADSTDTIAWIYQRSNGNTTLATCTPASCNNPYKPQFEASRPAGDRSTLTVNVSTTNYTQFIRGQTIVCKTNPSTGNAGSPQQTQCTVDIVAVPSVTCDAHYNTGTSSPWTVTGNCSVSGAYSYLNRYTCNLIRTSPTTNSLGSGSLTVTSTSVNGGKYKTGYCQVTVPFPDVVGVYSNKMAVTPGRQDVPASFGGQSSFEIKRPITPPSHNCPQYVGESQGTSCTCTATDLGQPAGVVRWTSTMTNQLSLNVNKTDNGTTYTCELMWNGQRTQSVTYTLHVVPESAPTTAQPEGERKTDPEHKPDPDPDPDPDFPVGVVVGVGVAVVVVSAIIVVVVLAIRRRRGKRQNPTPARPRKNGHKEEPEMIMNSIYGTCGDDDNGGVNPKMTPLSMRPPQPEGSVYENYAVQKDDSAEIDHQEAEPEPQGSRTVNPDGLVYITVGFSEEELKKAKDPPPEHETTAYAGIDYSKMHTQ